jgi:DNA-binding transcriptional LysR family regulator
MPIFYRNTKPISLTEAGKYYIQSVEKIMSILAEMQASFMELSTLPCSQLHIGSSMFFCTYVLPRILADFRDAYPQVALSFSEGDTPSMMQRVQEGHIDFLLEAEPTENPSLSSIAWASEQIVLAVPESYPINQELAEYRYTFDEFLQGVKHGWKKPCVPLKRFHNEKFLFLKQGNDIYKRGMAICRNAGFSPKVSTFLGQMMTAYYLVCEGNGITFLRSTIPEYVTSTNMIVFYRLDDELAMRNLYLTYKKKSASQGQKNLIDYMRALSLIRR